MGGRATRFANELADNDRTWVAASSTGGNRDHFPTNVRRSLSRRNGRDTAQIVRPISHAHGPRAPKLNIAAFHGGGVGARGCQNSMTILWVALVADAHDSRHTVHGRKF